MPKIKDVGIEFSSIGDDDLIPVQSVVGVTGRAIKSTLLNGISAGSGGSENVLNQIIYRDPTWRLDYSGNIYTSSFPCWSSMGRTGQEAGTGILKLGYLTVKNSLHFLVCGGGATNGNLKVLKIVDADSNVVILTKTLSEITLNVNNDNPVHRTIDTSAIANKRVYLQFEDSDSNNGWAWWAFVLGSFFVE